MQNITYPNQNIDIEKPHGWKDSALVLDTVKITFNLDNEAIEKAPTIVSNRDRALVKKKMLILGLKGIYTINNAYIYDILKKLYFSDENREKKLLRSIQSATPSIETHLAVVRGLSTNKFLHKCVNKKSSSERRYFVQ